MSDADTIDNETFAIACAPQALFGFELVGEAARLAVAHIRRPIARPWRDRAPADKPAAPPRSRRHA